MTIYSSYINHNMTDILARGQKFRATGDGMGWGREDDTLHAAAADMGAAVLCETPSGELLCELSDRLYLLSDVGGPWAVEVATLDNLS